MLDFVGVLLRVGVDAGHTLAVGGASDTSLGGVDVVVETVEGTGNDHGGDALAHDLHVVQLVDVAGSHGVVVEDTHGPRERTTTSPELGVETGLTLGDKLLVRNLLGLSLGSAFLPGLLGRAGEDVVVLVDIVLANRISGRSVLDLIEVVVVLNHGIVGNANQV